MCYIFHLVLLHVSFAVPKLARHELPHFLTGTPCNILKYLSYYSILACFAWLCVMCHSVRMKVHKCRKAINSTNNEANANEVQISHHITDIKAFYYYCLIALGLCVITTIAVVTLDYYQKPIDLYYCVRLQMDTKNFVFAPVLVIMTCGILLYIQTNLQLRKASIEVSTRCQKNDIELESKRFEKHLFKNICEFSSYLICLYRFIVFLKLFLVMIISWVFYIILHSIFSLMFHVITIMNILHTVAIMSILNDFFDIRARDDDIRARENNCRFAKLTYREYIEIVYCLFRVSTIRNEQPNIEVNNRDFTRPSESLLSNEKKRASAKF